MPSFPRRGAGSGNETKTKATSVVSGKARAKAYRVTYLYDGVERRSSVELG